MIPAALYWQQRCQKTPCELSIERQPDVDSPSWRDEIVAALKANDISFIVHVADRVLAPIITRLESDPWFQVVTLSREEEGIGVLTGAYMGGKRGAILLQSSGLGNTLNALGSLALPYQIPFVILLSPRGSYMEHNLVQLAWGKAVPRTVEAMDMQMFEMTSAAGVPFIMDKGIKHAFVTRRPVVLCISTQLSGGKDGA
jgi:sulfopyruvate decarboxylase alpha subunit